MSEPSDRNAASGGWRNWAGDQACSPARRRAPASVEELAAAVGDAAAAGMRVRVAGAGHSFSDIACTDGAMLGMQRMTRLLDVDPASGLVRVQAGITIRELSAQLDRHGLAMENLGDIDVQSIAGAISTATHGTGARLRNISSQVAELTLVLADGSTLVCSRAERARGVPRRPRRARRARRDRRGDAALRARVHAARGRRAGAAGRGARRASRSSRWPTTTSSSSCSRTPTSRSRAPTTAPTSRRGRAGGRPPTPTTSC